MFDNLGGNTDLLQYERGKDNIRKMLPPKVAHEYSQKEKRLTDFLEQATSKLKSDLSGIQNDFSTGAQGKSADKIKENIAEVNDSALSSSVFYGF